MHRMHQSHAVDLKYLRSLLQQTTMNIISKILPERITNMATLKTFKLLILSLSVLLSSGSSAFADWAGTYAGASIGGALFDSEVFDMNEEVAYGFSNNDNEGGLAGLHIGHNFQNGNFVYGGVLSLSTTDFDNSFETDFCSPSIHSTKLHSIASLRGRAGLVNENALIYVTAGIANISTNEVFECDSGNRDFVNDRYTAFVGGIGAEYKMQDNISVGFEYLIYEADDQKAYQYGDPDDDFSTFDLGAHSVTLSVNYFFN